jgi:hypothetical protein
MVSLLAPGGGGDDRMQWNAVAMKGGALSEESMTIVSTRDHA